MGHDKGDLFVELGTGIIKERTASGGFRTIRERDINFAKGLSGDRARGSLAEIRFRSGRGRSTGDSEDVLQRQVDREIAERKAKEEEIRRLEEVARKAQAERNVRKRLAAFELIRKKKVLLIQRNKSAVSRILSRLNALDLKSKNLARKEFFSRELSLQAARTRKALEEAITDGSPKFLSRLKREQGVLESQIRREGKDKSKFAFLFTNPLLGGSKAETKLSHKVAVVTAVEGVLGLVQLGKELTKLRSFSDVKALGKGIVRGAVDDVKATGKLLELSPNAGITKIGTQFFTYKATSKGLKLTGKFTGKATTRLGLHGRFIKVKNKTIKIRNPAEESFKVKGITRHLKERVKKRSFKSPVKSVADIIKRRKPGQFKKFQKSKGVELKVGILTDVSQPLSKQVAQGGKEALAVSAQAEALVNLINRKKVVRKPIPNEANFTPTTKKLLNRFDEGKLKKGEFIKLNDRVLKESGKSMLERSFFADPQGIVRFTRLGVEPRAATFKDILRGNFDKRLFKRGPQILFFDKTKVATFPKHLADVKRKLLANKVLTRTEASRLVEWQTKSQGLFKPIGDTKYKNGIEREITLAPGELIKRVRKVGVTEIEGVRVQIVQAEVLKTSKGIKQKINAASKGELPVKEIKALERFLSRKTNTRVRIQRKGQTLRRRAGSRPRIKIRKTLPRSPRRGKGRTRKRVTTARSPRLPRGKVRSPRPPRPKGPPRPKRPGKPRPPRPPRPKRPGKPRPPRPPRPPRKGPPKRGKPRTPRRFKGRKEKKDSSGYNVFARPLKKRGKKRPKLRKVNRKALRPRDAEDLRDYILDTSLSRTGKIKTARGKAVSRNSRVPKGYSKKNINKFRRFRIVKGKKKKLAKGKVIEKSRNLLDTKQEKRKISLARRIKQINKPTKKLKKKKVLPKQSQPKKKPKKKSKKKPTRKKSVSQKKQTKKKKTS